MSQADSSRPQIAEARTQSHAIPCGICLGPSGTDIDFSSSYLDFSCQYHSESAPHSCLFHLHRSCTIL
jgi:hypothetical protein